MRKVHARRKHRRQTAFGAYIDSTLCNREVSVRFTTVLFERVTCAHCLKQISMKEDAEAQEFMSLQVRAPG